MARKFRGDDTAKWKYGFGRGVDGNRTVSSNVAHDAAYAGGGSNANSGQKTVVIDGASTFANGDLVVIHQTRGTDAGLKYEFNRIISGGGTTTLIMESNLEHSYVESGADQFQVVEMKEYINLTVNNAITLSGPAWDGSKGGVVAIACDTANGPGTVSVAGKGYRGGESNFGGRQGEGSTAGPGGSTYAANGQGGGGGTGNNHNSDFKPQGGGGGGGHATSGGNGNQPGDQSNRGTGGGTAGNAALTIMVMGGGGGGSCTWNQSPYWAVPGYMNGMPGGGILILLARKVNQIRLNANGTDSEAKVHSNMGYGGAGAGGSILVKAQEADFGSGLVTANGGGVGAAGGAGRIHADIGSSWTGTTSPTIDYTVDPTIVPTTQGSALLAWAMS